MQNQRGVVTWAKRYDLLVTVLTLGREGALRERMLDIGKVGPGESVLDVGCTVMLHHLRRAAREACVREIRRVLKRGAVC